MKAVKEDSVARVSFTGGGKAPRPVPMPRAKITSIRSTISQQQQQRQQQQQSLPLSFKSKSSIPSVPVHPAPSCGTLLYYRFLCPGSSERFDDIPVDSGDIQSGRYDLITMLLTAGNQSILY